jgi:penicillin-binding protein 1C
MWTLLRSVWRSPRRIVAMLIAATIAAGLWIRLGPLPDGLLDASGPSTIVVDRNGATLYEALSASDTRAIRIAGDSLPPVLVEATLAAEDRRFWWHPGVDPVAMARALTANLAAGEIVEGGSTITQQVAKLLLQRAVPARRRGVAAKIREAVVALRLEHRFTKAELLAMYLNLAAYGSQYVGVERASRGYLGVPASMATPAQAAFLAGLPQRPSGFNPYRNRDAALRRQRTVLRRMARAGTLSEGRLAEALAERLSFPPPETQFTAPHFVEMVLAASGDRRPARLETTLDAQLQRELSGIIASHRAELQAHGAQNVAVVVLDNQRGEWLAWEGSGGYFAANGGAINGPVTPRQPGSALKPFTYALAFERGYGPASVLPDVPASFPTAEPGIVYTPRNYDGRYRGPLLARRALAGSENVPAVALASELGVPSLLRLLERAGLSTLDMTAAHYGLGVTLGNAEVRLDELVAAYAAFARGGEWVEPTFLLGDDRARARHRLVSTRTAFWIADILADAEAREYIFGRGGSLELPFPAAVKTGTSQAYHDNWTVGFTRHVTVGVWVGNFDRTPLRNSSGVTGAGPIFHAVMLAAERRIGGPAAMHASDGILPATADVLRRDVCALSGEAANDWCPVRVREWVAVEGPLRTCAWHQAGPDGVLTRWPDEYRSWARARGPDDAANSAGDATTVTVRHGAPAAAGNASGLAIVSPPYDATYSIDPTLRREFQALSLRAVGGAAGTIEWSVNGHVIGSADADAVLDWPLVAGRHQISVLDRTGRTAETFVTVR